MAFSRLSKYLKVCLNANFFDFNMLKGRRCFLLLVSLKLINDFQNISAFTEMFRASEIAKKKKLDDIFFYTRI